MALRLKGRYGYNADNPFEATFHPDKLDVPLHRQKPTIYASCFMGDIGYCHFDWMQKILEVVGNCHKIKHRKRGSMIEMGKHKQLVLDC